MYSLWFWFTDLSLSSSRKREGKRVRPLAFSPRARSSSAGAEFRWEGLDSPPTCATVVGLFDLNAWTVEREAWRKGGGTLLDAFGTSQSVH